jgi:hypothetical protein
MQKTMYKYKSRLFLDFRNCNYTDKLCNRIFKVFRNLDSKSDVNHKQQY